MENLMKETKPTTPRLQELEADEKRYMANGWDLHATAFHQAKGYNQALEELWPVVEAAREYMLSKSTASWVALRDALAGVE